MAVRHEGMLLVACRDTGICQLRVRWKMRVARVGMFLTINRNTLLLRRLQTLAARVIYQSIAARMPSATRCVGA